MAVSSIVDEDVGDLCSLKIAELSMFEMFLKVDRIRSVNFETNLLFDMPVPSPLNCPYSLIQAAQIEVVLMALTAVTVAASELVGADGGCVNHAIVGLLDGHRSLLLSLLLSHWR